ncbi:hypothetical protein AMECASPLE_036473 [Ameca splendens]|uniref:Uncharacterized protein n=1 Tax=Ameca splendens TaxID=208324 RepID=A0ABV0Y7S7_9TELE
MLKIVFVLGCLLCLTLAYSDDLVSNRVERSPGGHHPKRGHDPSHDNRPCINKKELERLLQILLNTAAATTTRAATSTAATTTRAATSTAATTTTAATATTAAAGTT